MKKDNVIKIALILILIFIVVVLISSLNNKTNYLSFEYKVESINKIEDDLHITFYNDESKEQEEAGKNIVYTIYGHQVDINLLNQIEVGDLVNITVEDNYGKFKYTIIYELKYNNEVIFNIMKDYSKLSYNNKIVFSAFFTSMIIFLVYLCIHKEKNKINKANDFEICRPLWEKYVFIGSIFGGLGFIIPFTALYILKACDIEYFKFSFVFYIFVLLGVFGIFVSTRQKFNCREGNFIYHKIFGKAVKVNISEIKYILIIPPKHRRGITKIEFYNLNNKKLIWFSLDFNLFEDGLFENVCKKHNIEIKLFPYKVTNLKPKKKR